MVDRLDHWDPFTDLELVRTVEVDLDATREACLLGKDASFAITATWSCTTTRLGGSGRVVELGAEEGAIRATLELAIPGAMAGGRLNLATRLVLRHPGDDASPISPRRPGTILWVETSQIALEGGASRFPITAVDFSQSLHYPDNAAWALDWNPDDLEVPVLGGLRLIINSCHAVLPDLLRSGSADSRTHAVRSFVMFDVARTLVLGALGNDRFVENPDAYEEYSVGRMLSDLMASCWPGVPVPTLRARSVDESPRFNAELQARFGVIG
ncbi:hypothetical protein [Mycolicibacterium pulveris]|uniref:hypothetical protein n=1 Tax=Mycolicibacterium pulveris TaxID=36813 RepID=UPI003CED6621